MFPDKRCHFDDVGGGRTIAAACATQVDQEGSADVVPHTFEGHGLNERSGYIGRMAENQQRMTLVEEQGEKTKIGRIEGVPSEPPEDRETWHSHLLG